VPKGLGHQSTRRGREGYEREFATSTRKRGEMRDGIRGMDGG